MVLRPSTDALQFGKYKVVDKLGVGGMAETFTAISTSPEGVSQRVCLKRVLPAYSDNEQFVNMFLAEARVTAALRHSNIAQLVDFGRMEDTFYLALELVDGVDLRSLLRVLPSRRLEPSLVALLGAELSQALDYAHSHRHSGHREGVIHRDISPSNVLVSLAGEVKLTDFGIAKTLENKDVTHTEAMKGKVPYMSPEQLKHGRIDARTDLFSLGILLFEALTGKRPFDGVTEMVTWQNIMAGERPALTEVAPEDTHKVLIEGIERLLEVDHEKRCESAQAFLEMIAPAIPPPTARRKLATLVRQARPQSMDERFQARDGSSARLRQPEASDKPDNAVEQAVDQHQRNTQNPTRTGHEPGSYKSDVYLTTSSRRPLLDEHAPLESQPKMTAPTVTSSASHKETIDKDKAKKSPRFVWRWVWAGASIGLTAGAVALWLWSRSSPPSSSTAPDSYRDRKAGETRLRENHVNQIQPSSATPELNEAVAPTLDVATRSPAREEKAPTIPSANQPNTQPPNIEAKPSNSVQTGSSQATLQVRASPWGYIWVDDRLVGRSPQDVKVSPGTHTVGVGPTPKTATKWTSVQMKRGSRKKVTLSPSND